MTEQTTHGYGGNIIDFAREAVGKLIDEEEARASMAFREAAGPPARAPQVSAPVFKEKERNRWDTIRDGAQDLSELAILACLVGGSLIGQEGAKFLRRGIAERVSKKTLRKNP